MAIPKIIDAIPPAAPFILSSGSFKTLVAPQVTMVTSLGSVILELDAANAPISTANLLSYVNDDFYNGLLFHRVIPGFVAQAGGFTTGLNYRAPTYDAIPLESNNSLHNLRGKLGMARSNAANSGTSQFYVNLADNSFLDYASTTAPGYAVFGKVISGMEVIDTIAAQPTVTLGNFQNLPQPAILITSATQTRAGISISKTGVVAVGALEAGARWEYSTNAGATWKTGARTSFTLVEGNYAQHSIQARQTDAAGNRSTYIGLSEVVLVVDKTAPKAISFIPTNAATSVGIAQTMAIGFSEEIMLGTGTITLKTVKGVVAETWQVTPGSGSSTTLTINPTNDLAYGTAYFLEISAGAITDLAANAYAGIKKFKFSTTDTVSTLSASYTLGSEANKLAFIGTGNFSGTGNEYGNTITGSDGNDSLWGGRGNDILFGGAGSDMLYGESGNDTLAGGSGNDYFKLSDPIQDGVDLFVDFTPGEDKISFNRNNFSGLPDTLTAEDLLVGIGKKAPNNGQHLIYNTKTGELWYDADGIAATPAVKIAIIGKVTHPILSVSDFLVE